MQHFSIKIFLLGLLLSFFTPSINAQTLDMTTETNIYTRSLSPKIEAEGSPYINDAFIPVKVNDNDVLYNGRYNAYNGEMEIILNDSENPIALDLRNDYTVKFINNNKVYETYKFKDDKGNLVNGFLVNVYATENYALLLREKINFQDKVAAKTSYQQDKPAKFVRVDDVYYIKVSDDKILPVPRRNKDLAELFPSHEDALKDFIKDERIKSDEKEDLIKFLKFVETL